MCSGKLSLQDYVPRFAIGRESHALGFVELILKGSYADQTILHRRRKTFLFYINQIACDHANARWQ